MLSHIDQQLAKAVLAMDWIPDTIFRPPPAAPDE
jgi:hypothetical protein